MHNMPYRSLLFVLLLIHIAAAPPVRAQEHSHDNGHDHGERLHFTHPLVTVALPTGSGGHHDTDEEHGHEGDGDHSHAPRESEIYEIEPFLSGGITKGPLEISGWARFTIPTNQQAQSEVETSFRYDISALYHVGRRLDVLAEITGVTGLSGTASGAATAIVVPGVRLRPFTDLNLAGALGVAVPLNGHETFDSRIVVSLFYHF